MEIAWVARVISEADSACMHEVFWTLLLVEVALHHPTDVDRKQLTVRSQRE